MSRIASGDTVVVKPTNNILTGLLAATTIAALVGTVLAIMKMNELLGGIKWL